jgi:DNA replication and repair protein RecF
VLASVKVENFRCIRHAALEFDARVTGISGPNASGKTSLLEAIFFLSHSRSFRSPIRSELISTGASALRIVGSVATSAGSTVAGIEFGGDERSWRLSGQQASAWQIAKVLPVQVIDPSVHRILEEGSARRRRLIDWGVFHVKPQFLEHWRKYQRVLAQRNALIRAGASESAISVWTEGLVLHAPAVHADRLAYIDLLRPRFEVLAAELINEPVSLMYRQGWAIDQELVEALEKAKVRDRRQRTTVVGPHRADVEIHVAGTLAKKRISRGQQKLLAAALILAQIDLRASTEQSPVCLLLDDPAAELDVDNLGKLLRVVERIPAQIVVTSLNEERFSGLPIGRAFHVEQGQFRPVL